MLHQKHTIHFLSIFFSIILLLSYTPESFSDSELKTVVIFVEPPGNEEIINNKESKNDEKNLPPQPNSFLPMNLPTVFVTGNEYALNSNPISIASDEGIALNNLLIEQIKEWENDANHTENFWSRTDQVIMGNFGVVNALENPLTENNYMLDGNKYSKNVKSNLDYFVQERGYDMNNLESVPNHMVTPKKYDLSRSVIKQWENPLANNLDVQHVRDLRDVAPNAFDFTPDEEMQMFRESVKTTSFQVVGSLMPKLIVDDSMFLPESDSDASKNDLENSLMNKDNNSLGMGTTESRQAQQEEKKEQEMFQQTNHIKDMIVDSHFDANYTTQKQQEFPLFEILTSVLLSTMFVSTLYLVKWYYRKPAKQVPFVKKNSKYDYLSDAESLLHEADSLYKNCQIKNAYEKLSQSIRVFYSNKLKLEKELVTSDLIPLMQNFKESEKSLIENTLRLSDMVEFAKHSDNNTEFQQIIEQFSSIIKQEKI